MRFHLIVVCMACFHGDVSSYRIALFPKNVASHLLYFSNLGKVLLSRGHNVTLVVASTVKIPTVVRESGIGFDFYKMHGVPIHQKDEFSRGIIENALNPKFSNYLSFISEVNTNVESQCESFLNDTDLIKRMKLDGYDFAVTDLFPCDAVLPYKLGVPFGFLGIGAKSWNFRLPDIPSYVPVPFLPYTPSMNFKQRSINILLHTLISFVSSSILDSTKLVDEYIPEKEKLSYVDISKRHYLFFNLANFMTGYPKAKLPNDIGVSGINVAPSKPLPNVMEEFVKNTKGIVVMSMGSWINGLPEKVVEKFLNAFSKLDESVIMKFKGPIPANVPKNVLLTSWIPQNDLLGHKKTKLFITHAGLNSFTEAVYHGIPLIAFPLGIDQYHNAAAIEHKEYGLWMSISDFTSETLLSNIQKVIKETKYKASVSKASKIFQETQAKCADDVVFWVEHVIKHGGRHLQNPGLDLAWYQYLMLDVLFVFCVVIFAVVCGCIFTCRFMRKLCCRDKVKLE